MKVIDKTGPPRDSVLTLVMAHSSDRTERPMRTSDDSLEMYKNYRHDGDEEDPKLRNSTEREVVIMKMIQHPNILQLYDVYESTDCM
jgi:serine/threonine protein kinase